MLLADQTHKLFLLERFIYSMNRSCSQRILDSTLKQSCSHQKFWGWEYKKKTYQKTYELQAGSQEFTFDFKGCDRQFDWLKISLLYDKSNKHLTIYDSYNAECAAGMIKKKKKKSSYRTYRTRTAQQIWWNSVSPATLKNICYGNNMLSGIVTVILPCQFPTTSPIQCFRRTC